MNMGGRRAVYDLMDMEPPLVVAKLKKKTAPKLEIDRTGANDPARYSGLKMGQVLDDDVMAQALQQAQERRKMGQSLRPKLQEEDYEKPFAGRYLYSVGFVYAVVSPVSVRARIGLPGISGRDGPIMDETRIRPWVCRRALLPF
jgi:hypothetical protein